MIFKAKSVNLAKINFVVPGVLKTPFVYKDEYMIE